MCIRNSITERSNLLSVIASRRIHSVNEPLLLSHTPLVNRILITQVLKISSYSLKQIYGFYFCLFKTNSDISAATPTFEQTCLAEVSELSRHRVYRIFLEDIPGVCSSFPNSSLAKLLSDSLSVSNTLDKTYCPTIRVVWIGG